MFETTTLLPQTPDWIDALCREMWLFRQDHEGGPVTHLHVTAGPLATEKVL
jgi:hypothetical protein